MDPVTLLYYGAICGCLSLVSPRIRPGVLRVLLGIVVGLAAATLLPALRSAIGA
jgi:hypothetical protein